MSRVIAIAGLLLLAMPARADEPLHRHFKDWQVVCDNVRHCVAFAGSESAGPGLMLERAAGPGTTPLVRIVKPFEGGPGALQLDGRALRLRPADWSIEPDGGARQTRSLGAVQRFIDQVRNGRRLHDPSARDPAEAAVSMAGFSAALLLIDEHQRRLGTAGALLRRGRKPDADIPAAPALPVLRSAATPPMGKAEARRILGAVRRAHGRDYAGQCDLQQDESDRVDALNTREALVALTCWRGAYQEGSMLFRASRKAPYKARALALPSPPGTESEGTVTNAAYDSDNGVLHHFAKGRGIADCGEATTWAFDGREFQLASHRFMPSCFGIGPEHWPWYWRSTLQPNPARTGKQDGS